jgi:hypothetical protein
MPKGRWHNSPDREKHNRSWSVGWNRRHAMQRREMPTRLVGRLRVVVAEKLNLEVLDYEHEIGPRPWWIDVWVRLPDGREAGLDIIWDSSAGINKQDLARQQAKEEWLREAGYPYLYVSERTSIGIESVIRRWLRRLRPEASAGDPPVSS